MSKDLNKEIRDFFIKIGEDIKRAFDECCPCNCLNNKNKIIASEISDIENQITQDIYKLNNANCTEVIIDVNSDMNECDLDVEEFKLEENVIVKRKQTFYYDCSEFIGRIDEGENKDNINENKFDGEFETKCESPIIEDDFVIIF
jgi:hypothetical protein